MQSLEAFYELQEMNDDDLLLPEPLPAGYEEAVRARMTGKPNIIEECFQKYGWTPVEAVRKLLPMHARSLKRRAEQKRAQAAAEANAAATNAAAAATAGAVSPSAATGPEPAVAPGLPGAVEAATATVALAAAERPAA